MDVSFGPDEQILWPASVLAGVTMCAAVYDLTRQVSSRCFKGYNGLTDMHKVEWNNRQRRGIMDVSFGPDEQILWPASVLAGVTMCAAVYDLTRQVSSRCFKGYNGLTDMHKVEWNNRQRRGIMDVSFGPDEQILWPASVLAGVTMCAAVYDLTRQVSSRCFKGYNGLTDMHKVEWNNRAFSTFHALAAAAVSFYLLVISDLFSEDAHSAIMIGRKLWLSDAMFGASLGYFLTDLAMILWYFPRLGGKEYLWHHGLSMYAISLALLSGKGHFYILMVLFTEVTTPFVNIRWYLDVAGRKGSKLYLYNGLALFVGWLVARIILFVYFFAHMYFHFDQVRSVFPLGFYSILTVPPVLSMMNLLWFLKICKGMVKTLCQAKQSACVKTE